jgi:ribonuclease Z
MTASCTFYGTSSASPSLNRGFSCIGYFEDGATEWPSALIDCGDGSIRKLLKMGVKVEKISTILISHYHSDHVTGLTQIIETMGIRRKTSSLRIFGPPGLKEYFSTVEKITRVASHRAFQIECLEINPNDTIRFEGSVGSAFQMDHTIPCLGYRVNHPAGKVLSYTGDTMPCPSIEPLGRDADLLIHEATFLDKDRIRAKEPKHSTALEAAKDGKAAQAKKLVLTHVNDDWETPEEMTREAQQLFANVLVAHDGLEIEI